MIRSFLLTGAFLFLAIVAGTPSVFAQTSSDYNKGEGFVGYMYKNVEGDSFNGVNAAGVGNFHKFIGGKFDFSYSKGPNVLGSRPDSYTYMGGLQFKDNRVDGSKVRPFGHVLLGGETQKWAGISDTAFTMAIGGGVDYKVSDRYSIRMIQADYQPAFNNGSTTNQARVSFGIVFH